MKFSMTIGFSIGFLYGTVLKDKGFKNPISIDTIEATRVAKQSFYDLKSFLIAAD